MNMYSKIYDFAKVKSMSNCGIGDHYAPVKLRLQVGHIQKQDSF